MMQFEHDFQEEYLAARNLSVSRRLNAQLKPFSERLEKHGSEIPRH